MSPMRFLLAMTLTSAGLALLSCTPEEERRFETLGGPIAFSNTGGDGGTGTTSGGGGDVGLFGKAYDANDPPKVTETASQSHAAIGQVQLNPKTECLTCHNPQGVAKNKPWGFGGYAEFNGGPATDGEIAVKPPNGPVVIVKIGSDGFFWSPQAVDASKNKIAARTKDGTLSSMVSSAAGGCSAAGSCHGGSKGNISFQ